MKCHLIDLFWLILLAGLGCLWWLWFGPARFDAAAFWYGLRQWHENANTLDDWAKVGLAVRIFAALVSAFAFLICVGVAIGHFFFEKPAPATETPAAEPPPDTDDLDYFAASALEGLIAAGATSDNPTEFNRRARFALRQARAVLLERARIQRGDDGSPAPDP